jgi:hypothetical protein
MTNASRNSTAVGMFLLASACIASAGPCSADSASKPLDELEIRSSSLMAALLQFGYEHGVCLGIEAPGLDLLDQPIQLHLAGSTPGEVVQALLKGKAYQFSEKGGVLLVRGSDSALQFTQLDTTIPDFTVPRTQLGFAELRLFIEIKRAADPSIQGFAGSIPGDLGPDVGPFEEHERSAREILTVVTGQAGGAWISGLCPAKDASSMWCWKILPYTRSTPVPFSDEINLRISELLAERKAQK